MENSPLIWALIDERPGTGTQSRAVSKSIGLPFLEKNLIWSPIANLPNFLIGPSLCGLTSVSKLEIIGPWPDLVISSGRRAAMVARYIKKNCSHSCGLVQIMSPGDIHNEAYDLIAIPNHDGKIRNRDNVIRTIGAPHSIDGAQLAYARLRWSSLFANLKKPIVGLVVGGATKRRPFENKMAIKLGHQTADFVTKFHGSLIVTTSPRSRNVINGVLKGLLEKNITPDFIYHWTATSSKENNPYLGFLAHADELIVTGESASMCSEACVNGKRIGIFAPKGLLRDKHKRLVDEMVTAGYAFLLGNDEEKVNVFKKQKKLDVANQIALEIKKRNLLKTYLASDGE
jgi:mitochondrial fission protein ELM1